MDSGQQARVPLEVSFQTKPEIALTLLDQVRAWDVPHRGVVADALDGDHPNVRAGSEAWQEQYVVAVRAWRWRAGDRATQAG